jgi:hypothetical protein
MLLSSISAAAGRPLDSSDLEAYLSGVSFLILDSIDEVPIADRELVGGQIARFASSHQELTMVVTARTSAAPSALELWQRIELSPLTADQVTEVLGQPRHARRLPDAVEDLATNPLMLGLLAAEIREGRTPGGEDDLLEGFSSEIIQREAGRDASLDEQSGRRVAEDFAWEWLATGRIGLDDAWLRNVSTAVAAKLRLEGFLHLDAQALERWFLGTGLATKLRGQALPAHRSILDHLASRAMPRRVSDSEFSEPVFREASARFIGSVNEVSPVVSLVLGGRSSDLEFLARCARLARADVSWPSSPEDFAVRYLAELRVLSAGPLRGLGVVPTAVRVQIDRGMSWVYQESGPSVTVDDVKVVDDPPRMYIQVGGQSVPVVSFRMGGRAGRDISVRIPEISAYMTAKAELLDRLGKKLLPDESPEMTYERLCQYAKRLGQVLNPAGPGKVLEYSRETLESLPPNLLAERLLSWVQLSVPQPIAEDDLARLFIAWIPQSRSHGILLDASPAADDPYDPGQHRSGTVIHGAPLLLLLQKARQGGWASLPLHPLGLLPEGPEDPILGLPRRRHGFDRAQAELYISCHELAELRSIRYVVERAFAGLADRIASYAGLPSRISIVLKEGDSPLSGGWSLEGRIEHRAARDEVRFVDNIGEAWEWRFSSGLSSYQGVVEGVYRTLRRELDTVLGGERALGNQDLS